ncbi:MAG: hypothetical protein IJ809_03645 [Clostridia bacterium]|nr:hypothetical protein [Clostridia bacterium]
MVKSYIVKFIIIFIALILVSNYLGFKVNNESVNSLYFDDNIKNSVFKIETRNTDIMYLFLNDQIGYLVDKEYSKVFKNLTDESKAIFSNKVEEFGAVVAEKYFADKSQYTIDILGYYPPDDNYLFCINIEMPYYIKAEEYKMEVYQPKQLYIAIYEEKDGSYLMDWNYSW